VLRLAYADMLEMMLLDPNVAETTYGGSHGRGLSQGSTVGREARKHAV
jgi:hypothetical protein